MRLVGACTDGEKNENAQTLIRRKKVRKPCTISCVCWPALTVANTRVPYPQCHHCYHDHSCLRAVAPWPTRVRDGCRWGAAGTATQDWAKVGGSGGQLGISYGVCTVWAAAAMGERFFGTAGRGVGRKWAQTKWKKERNGHSERLQ